MGLRFVFFAIQLIFTQWKVDFGKTLLGLLSIALGVSVFVSIHHSSNIAYQELSDSVGKFSQGVSLSVRSKAGRVDEGVMEAMHPLEEVSTVSPYSTAYVYASMPSGVKKRVQLIGLDLLNSDLYWKKPEGNTGGDLKLFSLPYSGFASKTLVSNDGFIDIEVDASRLRVRVSPIEAESDLMTLFGGDVVVVDISIFQDIFHEQGYVHRFDVVLKEGTAVSSAQSRLSHVLPPALEVVAPSKIGDSLSELSSAFRFNLSVMSGISLILAMLMVYNTASFFGLKRTTEFSSLLALGAKPLQILYILILESITLGLLGGVLAFFFGGFISQVSSSLVDATISSLYVPIQTNVSLYWSLSNFIFCLILGSILSIISFAPLFLKIYRSSINALFVTRIDQLPNFGTWKLPLLSLVIGCVGVCLPYFLTSTSNWLGLLPPLSVLLATGVMLPFFCMRTLSVLRSYAEYKSNIGVLLGLDHLLSAMGRNLTTMAVMFVACATAIGLSSMVVSFRTSVEDWIYRATAADAYVSPDNSLASGEYSKIPLHVLDYLESSPEFEDVDYVYQRRIEFSQGIIDVSGVKLDVAIRKNRLDFQDSKKVTCESCAFISKGFARRFSYEEGDQLVLPGVLGEKAFVVSKIFSDYSSERGLVMISGEDYKQLYGPSKPSGISLYSKSISVSEIRKLLSDTFPSLGLVVRDNTELREAVLKVFDHTFSLTYLLMVIAFVISIVSTFSSVLMMLYERSRDFMTFIALGATRKMLRRLITIESTCLGCISMLYGMMVGVLLSYVLIKIVNPFYFHWTFPVEFSWVLILIFSSITLAISFLVGFMPSKFYFSKINAADLRND